MVSNFHNVPKTGWEDVVQDMPPHCSMAKFGLYVGKSMSITQYHRIFLRIYLYIYHRSFQIYYTAMERMYEHT